MFFYWPKLNKPAYSVLLFLYSLLSFYRLVLWGWGLWTDNSKLVLSQHCIADTFLNNNNNNNNKKAMLAHTRLFLRLVTYCTLYMSHQSNLAE